MLLTGSMQAWACLFMLYMEDAVFKRIALQKYFLQLLIFTNSEIKIHFSTLLQSKS